VSPIQSLFIFFAFHLLIFSPWTNISGIIGAIPSARKTNNEFHHPTPREVYIFGAASGRAAAKTERTIVFDASAEAA
jgi:hypothetical protein